MELYTPNLHITVKHQLDLIYFNEYTKFNKFTESIPESIQESITKPIPEQIQEPISEPIPESNPDSIFDSDSNSESNLYSNSDSNSDSNSESNSDSENHKYFRHGYRKKRNRLNPQILLSPLDEYTGLADYGTVIKNTTGYTTKIDKNDHIISLMINKRISNCASIGPSSHIAAFLSNDIDIQSCFKHWERKGRNR